MPLSDRGEASGMGKFADIAIGWAGFVWLYNLCKFQLHGKIIWSGSVFYIIFIMAVFAHDLFCDRRNIQLLFAGKRQKR